MSNRIPEVNLSGEALRIFVDRLIASVASVDPLSGIPKDQPHHFVQPSFILGAMMMCASQYCDREQSMSFRELHDSTAKALLDVPHLQGVDLSDAMQEASERARRIYNDCLPLPQRPNKGDFGRN